MPTRSRTNRLRTLCAARVVELTAGQNARVRVVYNFSRVDFDGSRTAYLNLTKDDLEPLQILSDQFTPEPQ